MTMRYYPWSVSSMFHPMSPILCLVLRLPHRQLPAQVQRDGVQPPQPGLRLQRAQPPPRVRRRGANERRIHLLKRIRKLFRHRVQVQAEEEAVSVHCQLLSAVVSLRRCVMGELKY